MTLRGSTGVFGVHRGSWGVPTPIGGPIGDSGGHHDPMGVYRGIRGLQGILGGPRTHWGSPRGLWRPPRLYGICRGTRGPQEILGGPRTPWGVYGGGSIGGPPHLLQQVRLLDGLQDALLGGVLDLPPHDELVQDEVGLLEVEDDVKLADLPGKRGGHDQLGGPRPPRVGG